MSYVEYGHAEPQSDDLLSALARVHGFTLDELEENRQGRISAGQRWKLWQQALEPLRFAAMTMAGWLIFLFVIKAVVPDLILWIVSLFAGKSVTAFFFVVTIGCGLALLVAALKCTSTTIGLIGDLRAGAAARLEGRVSISRDEEKGQGMRRLYGEKVGVYAYVINNEHFAVSQEALEALASGSRYRLYCTPRSRLLLSIEPF
jgi:hypothetical protein